MISKKEFDDGNFKGRKESETKLSPAIEFLLSNKEKAYSVKEISKESNQSTYAVRRVLKKAIAENLVVCKSPYFIAK